MPYIIYFQSIDIVMSELIDLYQEYVDQDQKSLVKFNQQIILNLSFPYQGFK